MKKTGRRLFAFILILFQVPWLPSKEGEDKIKPEYAEVESWEPDDLYEDEALDKRVEGLVSPFTQISLSLIRFYQKQISPNSISGRCPYKISCSNFAYRSISERGFLIGILLFVDRFYYRENSGTRYYYPLFENTEGVLKLEDDFYLTGDIH